jgi:uncharacterized protein YdhG (YjbR/CyaY superfamily)
MNVRKKYPTVDSYMSDFSGETRERIGTIRKLIHELEPEIVERISYNIPAFFIGKTMVVYFAGYAHHVSLYPLHLIDKEQQSLFKKYASGKATLKLPNSEPLPIELIEKFISQRLESVRSRK